MVVSKVTTRGPVKTEDPKVKKEENLAMKWERNAKSAVV